jgi:hypothetical protein
MHVRNMCTRMCQAHILQLILVSSTSVLNPQSDSRYCGALRVAENSTRVQLLVFSVFLVYASFRHAS